MPPIPVALRRVIELGCEEVEAAHRGILAVTSTSSAGMRAPRVTSD
jgi:hypothetical protein